MADDDSYEGVTVAGLVIVAADTGRVFLAQRSLDETDDPDVRETFEFPGGHLNDGEEPWAAAEREFGEEIGLALPDGQVTDGWRSKDDAYQAFVYQIPYEFNVADWAPTEEVQSVGWFGPDDIEAIGVQLRPEVSEQTDWTKVFGESVTAAATGWGAPSETRRLTAAAEEADMEDDDFDPDDFSDFDEAIEDDGHIPFHGVAIVFDQDTGDRRAFPSEGNVRFREVPFPLMFAPKKGQGHNGAEIVGLVTRITRAGNEIRYSGYFADTDLTDPLIGLIADFGRLNLSVDLDDVREVHHDEDTGVTIFSDTRVAGMTALAIGAFAETYIALGPSENEDEDATPEEALELVASAADPQIAEFARGPGWATNPRATSRIYRYWTQPGQPGYRKIRWNTPGDFYRCRRLVGAKIAKNSPDKLRFINQICSRWHRDVTGLWTGDRRNPGNRKASAAMFDTEALTASALAPLPAEWFTEPAESKMTFSYDEATGFTRVSGLIAQFRRCHLGYGDRCVTAPRNGSYRLFLKGQITTSDGELAVGALTFGTGHPGLKTTIAEAQAHYDNTGHAWAFVNVGENREGIWFSGVVNPDLSPETVFAIKAGGAVSGDWKAYEGRSELVAALSVNVPGFPQPLVAAAFGADEEVLAMTAAGIVMAPEEDRLAALRELAASEHRTIQIARFKALTEGEI